MSDDVTPLINHQEAYELACFKRENSNLARSYLDLRARLEQAEARLKEPYGYIWFTRHMERRFTHGVPREGAYVGDIVPVYALSPTGSKMSDSDESDNTLTFLIEPYLGTCSGCDKRKWLIYDHIGNHYCSRVCFEDNCGING